MELYEQNQLLKYRIINLLKSPVHSPNTELYSSAVLFAYYDTEMDHPKMDHNDGFKKMNVMTFNLMANSCEFNDPFGKFDIEFFNSYFAGCDIENFKTLQKRYINQINYVETMTRARAYLHNNKMKQHIPLVERMEIVAKKNDLKLFKHPAMDYKNIVWMMSRDWGLLSSDIMSILNIDYDLTMEYWTLFIRRNEIQNKRYEICVNILNQNQLAEENRIFANATVVK